MRRCQSFGFVTPRPALLLLRAGLAAALPAVQAVAGNASSPGLPRTYATVRSIGIQWNLLGDDDHDAVCPVQYRALPDAAWRDVLPLFRVDYAGSNMMAGSILFLEPGTAYEIQLQFSDPDGGLSTRRLTAATRPEPAPPTGGRTLHVIPGSGGGAGTPSNPFRGVAAAEVAARAGDVCLLHAGNYGGPIALSRPGAAGNYLVWKAAGDGDAVLNGIDVQAGHVWIEGLKLTTTLRTTDAPADVVVVRNRISAPGYCIWLTQGGSDWYIVDNIITGETAPGSGNTDTEGIELNHTSGHTVAYNRISRVADGISYPHSDCDIFGNDIFDVADDGIEPDFGRENIRIWGNRIHNAVVHGISFQPMAGAPWYVLRNQIVAGHNALKLRDPPLGPALLAHNTLVVWTDVQTDNVEALLSLQANNNLWISVSGGYVWENLNGGTPTWQTHLDYDGFDWGGATYAFKWGGTARYRSVAAFAAATGLQTHGIPVQKATCFATFNVPAAPPAAVPPQCMALAAGSPAIDAGRPLAGINDGFSGTAPDLGAYEYGHRFPHYGPRWDTDGDELPDTWETEYFGSLEQTPLADADGDGLRNGEEYVCGSDPAARRDAFRVGVSVSNRFVLVSVPGLPAEGRGYDGRTRYYSFEEKSGLRAGQWTSVPRHERIQAQEGAVVCTNWPAWPARCYRATVWLE